MARKVSKSIKDQSEAGRQAAVRASPGAVMSCLTPSQSHTAAHPSEFVELIPCSSEDRQI